MDPTDPDHLRELKATVVAISNDLDVAILKCETLQSPPVRVSSEIPRRGSEIMVLGYPREKLLGRGIKTTKGIITALPAPDHYNMLLFDAEANPGNSGGPVCNDRGVVVALMTIVISPTGGKYTGGVPTAHIIKFIQKHVPGFQIAKGKAPKIEWPDVDAKVSQSTVMLVSYYKGTAFGLDVAASKSQKSINYFEDKTCTVCKGHAHLRCPNNGCHKGAITIKVLQKKVVVNKLGFRNIITTPRFFKKPCPVCHGRDRVDCPHCTTGLDPTL